MKNIAFITRALGVGGIEKSLVGLINALPEDEFNITVLTTDGDRRIASDIKRQADIRLLPFNSATAPNTIIKSMLRFKFKSAFSLLRLKIAEKRGGDPRDVNFAHAHSILVPKEKFDVAIAYYLPDSYEIPYCLDCVKARKKAVWMHMDLNKYAPRMPYMERYYKRFKRVFCVSFDAQKRFGEVYPKLKKRTRVFHNIIEGEAIIKKSEEYSPDLKGVSLFTCARVSFEKQPVMCADALKKLIDGGINAYWYWAGGDTNNCIEGLKKRLKELDIEDRFILLGALTNPYPYYRACDVYVQPSEHESYCISVSEAKILSGRIVCTNFPAASEQLSPTPACTIVGQSSLALADGIKSVLNAPREKFKAGSISEEMSEFKRYLNS